MSSHCFLAQKLLPDLLESNGHLLLITRRRRCPANDSLCWEKIISNKWKITMAKVGLALQSSSECNRPAYIPGNSGGAKPSTLFVFLIEQVLYPAMNANMFIDLKGQG